MSPAALRAVFSPDADADLFFLLTVYDPQNPTQIVARLSDGYTQRISETADEVIYGVRSRNQNFTFLPMEITLPSEDEAQAPRCTLTLNDVTRYVTPLIRTVFGFYISSITYNANTVSAELAMIDYEREPFPQHSFSPKYFPGLF